MKITGFQSLTLSDYPGHVAALLFTQGCNFRCPFCHNGHLVLMDSLSGTSIQEETILEMLQERKKILDGVVITGGEPTIQPDIVKFIQSIRAIGYKIKLDTNGSRPIVLQELLQKGLVDYIAMDIKAPFPKYDLLAGVKVNLEDIETSIRLLCEANIKIEFRTTFVKPLLSDEDIKYIKQMIPNSVTYKLQDFVAENTLDETLRKY